MLSSKRVEVRSEGTDLKRKNDVFRSKNSIRFDRDKIILDVLY